LALRKRPAFSSHWYRRHCGSPGTPQVEDFVYKEDDLEACEATRGRCELRLAHPLKAQPGSCGLILQLRIGKVLVRIKDCNFDLQHGICMPKFTVRTAEQLPPLLQAFRKEAGLTQSEVALRLGVSQQTYSALERNADKVGTARLLKLLNILGVELALGTPAPKPAPGASGRASPDKPVW
jgi:HTH-type transcriptional regulator / antitoxin HipB